MGGIHIKLGQALFHDTLCHCSPHYSRLLEQSHHVASWWHFVTRFVNFCISICTFTISEGWTSLIACLQVVKVVHALTVMTSLISNFIYTAAKTWKIYPTPNTHTLQGYTITISTSSLLLHWMQQFHCWSSLIHLRAPVIFLYSHSAEYCQTVLNSLESLVAWVLCSIECMLHVLCCAMLCEEYAWFNFLYFSSCCLAQIIA